MVYPSETLVPKVYFSNNKLIFLIKKKNYMPQLVPFFFVNQVVFAFIILIVLIFLLSKYILPKFVRIYISRIYINKL